MKLILNIFFLLILFSFSQTKGQTFGFGCLGLSGFYAGVTQQYYDSPGLNEYINSSVLFSNYNTQIDFKRGTGYRIGANIFRAKFDVLFITAKGYYQFLKESYERTNINPEEGSQKFELAMNHWGVGMDFGIPLFSIIDWKIVEGNVTFYNSQLTEEYLNADGSQISETKYKLDKAKVGYFVGSGLILHLVPDYISVEATAGFSFIDLEKFSKDDVTIPVSTSSNKAVNKGGFSATVQLNVGFPL